MSAVLHVAGLRRHFRGVRAIDGVDLELAERHSLGLIGPNGAGKSTLFRLVTGLLEADAGQIVLSGRDVTRLPPEERVRQGLGWTFQHTRYYPDLTVRQHLEAAWTASAPSRDAMESCLGALELLDQAEHPAYTLTLSQRKLLDVARATWAAPEVLLLDEPFAGLGKSEAELLQRFLADLKRSGTALLVIEHRLERLFEVVADVAVLAAGRIIHRGSPRETLESPPVLRTYFGNEDDALDGH